jgi:hypothetical protein
VSKWRRKRRGSAIEKEQEQHDVMKEAPKMNIMCQREREREESCGELCVRVRTAEERVKLRP